MDSRSVWLVRLVKGLGQLPLWALHGAGACLGRLTFLLSKGMRAKTRNNLLQAGLFEPRLAWKSASAAGRAALECAFVWFRDDADLLARCAHEPMARLARETMARQAAGDRRGLILLTPHIGCFEMAARSYGAWAPITVLFKAPRDKAVRHLLEVGRSHSGVTPVPADTGGVRGMLKALKRGEAIGILPDQVPSAGDGEWADFFGRPAFTMTLPMRLAEKTGARVCLLAVWRRPHGRGWDVEVEEIDELPTPQVVNARIEALIRRHPDQYVWNYNRYKVPAGTMPPEHSSQPAVAGHPQEESIQ